MSDTTFMRNNLPEVFPPRRYGSVKAAQIAAYDFMKRRVNKELKLRRIRQLWEGKAARVDGEEKDALREAEIEEARNEYKALRRRLERLETFLALANQACVGATLDEGGKPTRRLVGGNRSGARE